MLYLYTANRLEYLAATLAQVYQQPLPGPLWQGSDIVVQSQGMRRYLNRFLAQQTGVAANIRYRLPAGFAWQLLRRVLPDIPALNPFHPEVMRWRLLSLFHSSAFQQGDWTPVRTALGAYLAGGEAAAYRLAGQLADIFDQYLVYRPDWIDGWRQGRKLALGDDEHWQALLWRYLDTDGGHRVDQWRSLLDGLKPEHLPPRLLVFGLAALAPVYWQLLQAAAAHTEVHVFALNPSSHYWGEIQSLAQLARQGDTNRSSSGHPLLASLGKQGRDFFDALAAADTAGDVAVYDDEAAAGHLLAQLQHDIQTQRLPEHRDAPLPVDDSIQFVAAHSPLRELQILKEQLLHDLAAHPDWQPHDIAVLTPDIEPYLPFIDAVFGHEQNGSPALPYSVADIKTSRRRPLLQWLQHWLSWAQSRCEADALLTLFDSPALQRRHGLSTADVALWRRVVVEQGIRWGSDAAMRAKYGGHDDGFTWQHGRERTVLGWLLPERDGLCWQGVLPWPADPGLTPALARCQQASDVLLQHHRHWQSPADVPAWVARVRALLADCVDEDSRSGEAMQQLEQTLGAWAEHAALAGFDQLLSLTVAAEHLQGFLDSRDEAGFLRGGITFCSMVPMRSLPFKCLCLLGLNDGDYPRTTKAASFDLIRRHPRRGDRARRDDDRYLFLESILSAREKLYLSYVGKDIRKNDNLAPSALLNELGDTLAAMSGTPAQQWLPQHVRQHPLQAFSPQYFAPGWFSHRQDHAAALSQPSPDAQPFYCDAGSAAPPPANAHIDSPSLLTFWRNPLRAWLQQQLGWRDVYADAGLNAAEPFAISEPELLNRHYLDARRAHRDPSSAQARLQQMNALPAGLLGEAAAAPWCQAVRALDDTLVHSRRLPESAYRLNIDGTLLTGSLGQLHDCGQILPCHRAPSAPDWIAFYLQHLLFCAADITTLPACSHILYPPAPATLHPLPAAEAHALLKQWLAAYHLGQSRPLPFLAKTSLDAARAWAAATDSTEPPPAAVQAARQAYYGNRFAPGQQQRREVALVFGGAEPAPIDTPLFWDLVRRLLCPLLRTAHPQC